MYLEEDLPAPAEGSRRSNRLCRRQLDGCADAGGGGLKRVSVEIWGGAEWGVGVVCADRWTAGHGEGEGKEETVSLAARWSLSACPTLCLHKAQSLEMRNCCKQKCASKPRSTWGLSFSALQELHFIRCHYERVLLYSKKLNQRKCGL